MCGFHATALLRTGTVSHRNPQQLAAQLVKGGAVLQVLTFDVSVLIGYWEWLDPYRVFFFEAGGENEFAGHIIKFHHAVAAHHFGVEFHSADDALIAYLTTIEEAVDDAPELYVETWRAWQSQANSLLAFIQQVKRDLTAD